MPRPPDSPLNPLFRESIKTASNYPAPPQTADLRGFIVDTRALQASAGAVPQIDPRGFIAQAGAGAAIGQAVSSVGNSLAEIQAKQMEAINIRKESEAIRAMDEEDAKILAAIKNEPDETKWHDIANTRIAAFRERLLDKEANPLSPVARAAIVDRLDVWQSRRRAGIITQSADHSRQRAADEVNAQIIRSMDKGDYETPRQLARKAVEAGYFGADQEAKLEVAIRDHADKAAREERMNNTLTVARTQGREAARKYADEHGADAIEKEKLLSAADSVHRDMLALKTEELSNAIASGQITVPAEIDNWEPDNPTITPEVRAQYKAHLIQQNNAIEKERQRANAPENMSRLVSEIQNLDPEKATDADFVRLDLAVQSLPEGYRRVPSQKLDIKLNRARSADNPDDDSVKLGDDILHSMLNAGKFGSFDNGTGKDSKGNPAIGIENGEVSKRDPKQYQEALTRKAKVGGQFHRWIKANPKATPDEIQKQIYKLTGEPVAAGLLDDLFGPPPQSIGPVDLTGELPRHSAGPPENILLPKPPPQ